MATINTPRYRAKGSYVLRTPFSVDVTLSYECIAIRSFEELTERNIDVFELVYAPVGLAKTDMAADQAAGASIVTLYYEATEDYIYVPDTYITQFPSADNVPYGYLVIGAEVGPLPDAADLTLLTEAVTAAIGAAIGLNPTVKLIKVPTTGIVSQEEHDAMENIRTQAITYNQADYIRLDAALSRISELEALNQDFMRRLIDAGVITPA